MLACEYVNSTVSSGSALVRDLRTWHGGAPNNSTVTRFLPNIEAVSQQYIAHLEQCITAPTPSHHFTKLIFRLIRVQMPEPLQELPFSITSARMHQRQRSSTAHLTSSQKSQLLSGGISRAISGGISREISSFSSQCARFSLQFLLKSFAMLAHTVARSHVQVVPTPPSKHSWQLMGHGAPWTPPFYSGTCDIGFNVVRSELRASPSRPARVSLSTRAQKDSGRTGEKINA